MPSTFVACDGFIPLRAEPTDRSEQVTQLLFGEAFTIEEAQGKWLRVTCLHDGYPGWIAANQAYAPVDAAANRPWVVNHRDVLVGVQAHGQLGQQPIGMGSLVYGEPEADAVVWDSMGTLFRVPLNSLQAAPLSWVAAMHRVQEALRGVPYLWGGRSAWGVDCSGLVQLAGRLAGMHLPRDASQQATVGHAIPFAERQPGDLAFFHNQTGAVVHVGFVNDPIDTILHASGSVRVDYLTEVGIYNRWSNQQTHHLHAIRRLLA